MICVLVLCFSKAYAQDIKPKDLIGKWAINDGEKEIEFLDSTNSLLLKDDSAKTDIWKGTYSISWKSSEFLLSLNIDSSGKMPFKRFYLIRSTKDTGEYDMQLLQAGKNGFIESYEWRKKYRIDYLYREVFVKYSIP